jgi:hypothetical protein
MDWRGHTFCPLPQNVFGDLAPQRGRATAFPLQVELVAASMVACPKCGKEVEDDAYFCKFCGSSLREAQAIDGDPSNPSELRRVVERRLNAIRDKDEAALQDVLDESVYTKFDDWPPFTLQDSRLSGQCVRRRRLGSLQHTLLGDHQGQEF